MGEKLTKREGEVYLELVTNSGNLADIASKLCLSRTTVQTYMQNISYKLGVSGRAELIIRYYQQLLANTEGLNEVWDIDDKTTSPEVKREVKQWVKQSL